MKKTIVAIALALTISVTGLQADLVTSNPGGTVVDFSQFTGGFDFTAGPVQVGGLVGENIVYTSTSSNSVIGDGTYGLDGNGFWDGTQGINGYVGTNDGFGNPTVIRFDFNDGPVSSVGGFVNYAVDGGGSPIYGFFTITALDAGNNVLESYDITTLAPISTPGALNEGDFRGITRNSADIAAFTIDDAYGVLDDLTFSRGTVPEPGSAMVLAFIGIATCFRRRR